MTTLTRRIALAAAAAASLVLAAPRLAAAAPAKGVVCKDGSTDEGGRGACSGHGGIDKAATAKAEAEAATAEKAAKAEARAKAKKEKEEARVKKEAEKAEKAKEQAAAKAAKAKEAGEQAKEGAEAVAMVTCKDGTTSKGGRGACRGHGGVDREKMAGAAGAAMPAAQEKAEHAAKAARHATEHPAGAAKEAADEADASKGPPTAKCKDGSFSHSEHHAGACSRHGGVEEWLDKK